MEKTKQKRYIPRIEIYYKYAQRETAKVYIEFEFH